MDFLELSKIEREKINKNADKKIKEILQNANEYNAILNNDLFFELQTNISVSENYKINIKIARKSNTKEKDVPLTENQKDKIITITEEILKQAEHNN